MSEPRLLDIDALQGILAPGGRLSRHDPGYEDRPAQREMLRHVADSYNGDDIAIVEAGTGTGKSLAYLIPALAWAVENEERTVLSTNTINLQEQLSTKDLPLVRDLLDEEFDWALVKGRANYVSIRRARLAAASANDLFLEDRSAELKAILDWIERTEDGSLSDLPFQPSTEAWEEVRSDSDICLRTRCPHYRRCFYQRSRRRANTAELLVVNHHLLFTDLALRSESGNFDDIAVLPPYRRLILDEAHNVEDAATSHLGVEVTRGGIFRLFSRLDHGGRGVLAVLEDQLAAEPPAGESGELRARIGERVAPALSEARSAAAAFLEALEPSLPPRAGEPRRIGWGAEALPEPIERPALREALGGFLIAIDRLARETGELRVRIEGDEVWGGRLEGRLLDLASLTRRLVSLRKGLHLILDPGEEEASYVRWMERRPVRARAERHGDHLLAAAPIEVGDFLRRTLFQEVRTVVLTSGTLTTRGRFDFLRERLGLQDAGAEVVLPSPFDFREQSRFCVPTDLPDLRSSDRDFQRATARIALETAELTGGGLFLLFTSYRALGQVADHLRGSGAEREWPLFVQGEASRSRLLEGFIRSERGILLGTASFWEGVDVPGDPLRALILQKLPFRVPAEPVTAARIEAMKSRGEDAFWGYLLPLAALRLKQGFGRLIRSRTDHGAIVLLDDRILTRRYGRYLRASLPPAPLVKGLWVDVRRKLRDFYGERPRAAE